MFQFRWCPTYHYLNLSIVFIVCSPAKQEGFLHSETAGSKEYGSSPTNIATICVLPRQTRPRHPLSALILTENKRPKRHVTVLDIPLFFMLTAFVTQRIVLHKRITPYDATTHYFSNPSRTLAVPETYSFASRCRVYGIVSRMLFLYESKKRRFTKTRISILSYINGDTICFPILKSQLALLSRE